MEETLWATIATARAYEKAARKAFKELMTSRPDVFGEAFTTSNGEVRTFGLSEGTELPGDGRQVKARASAAAHLVAALIDHRRKLLTAVGNVIITGTRHSRREIEDAIADIVADIEEAHGIGITAKIKPYISDITGGAIADIVTTARHTAAQARANHNDEYADDITMLLNDLRQTIWDATEGRTTIRHIDADAIFTAMNALALTIEDI